MALAPVLVDQVVQVQKIRVLAQQKNCLLLLNIQLVLRMHYKVVKEIFFYEVQKVLIFNIVVFYVKLYFLFQDALCLKLHIIKLFYPSIQHLVDCVLNFLYLVIRPADYTGELLKLHVLRNCKNMLVSALFVKRKDQAKKNLPSQLCVCLALELTLRKNVLVYLQTLADQLISEIYLKKQILKELLYLQKFFVELDWILV